MGKGEMGKGDTGSGSLTGGAPASPSETAGGKDPAKDAMKK
jgi:hypothetical protein